MTTLEAKPRPAKGYKGMGMEGFVARWYARTTHQDLSAFAEEAERVAKTLRTEADVLEVAPGPGYFAIELAKRGSFHITGLDISHTFVQIATANAAAEGLSIDFRQGNASTMPFADQSFDFVYCRAAFKNFSQPVEAINQMHRVLRSGGRAVICDLRKDASMDDVNAYIKQSGRSRMDALLTRWTFRALLIKRAYSRGEFLAMAHESRFGDCRIETDAIGMNVEFEKAKS